jgi:hypothetical protein
MSKEEKVRELILECIQSLQQHPDLHPSMYRSYLYVTRGDALKKYGVTVEQVCDEWEKRSRRRKLAATPTTQ